MSIYRVVAKYKSDFIEMLLQKMSEYLVYNCDYIKRIVLIDIMFKSGFKSKTL